MDLIIVNTGATYVCGVFVVEFVLELIPSLVQGALLLVEEENSTSSSDSSKNSDSDEGNRQGGLYVRARAKTTSRVRRNRSSLPQSTETECGVRAKSASRCSKQPSTVITLRFL